MWDVQPRHWPRVQTPGGSRVLLTRVSRDPLPRVMAPWHQTLPVAAVGV